MIGGSGNDILSAYGGNGHNRLRYLTRRAVDVDLLKNITIEDGYGDTDRLRGITNVIGSPFDDHIRGNRLNNLLDGLAGNDILAGESGNDRILGRQGEDQLFGGDGNDDLDGGLASEDEGDRLFGG